MAFRTKKISQMDPKGANLASTDLLEISQLVSGSYVTKSITGAEIVASVPASVTAWGTITGTLSAQTDLNTALSGKVPTTRTLTINGTTQDLSADRTFTISTGITIGTTAITSGTVGRVLFEGTGNVVQESIDFAFNTANSNLLLGRNASNTSALLFQYPRMAGINGVIWAETSASSPYGYIALDRGTGEMRMFTANGYFPSFYSSNAERMRIGTTGNVLINTTTDAGFKLDVNGTARVSVASGTLTNQFTIISSSSRLDVSAYDSITYGVIFRPSVNNGGAFVPISIWGSRIQLESSSVHISTNATGGNASAILDVTSTTKGFLPPRMTTVQKNAIATPAAGLMVYDSTLNKLCVRTASAWETITSL